MEEESRTALTDSIVVNDITEEEVARLEGDGAVPVSPQEIERMQGEEKNKWIDSMKEELASLNRREVYDEVTNQDLHRRYWSKGIRTKQVPGRLLTIKKPLHDGEGGWKHKARAVVCGNCEPGSIANDIHNRAEVPTTFELRTLLALGSLGEQVTAWNHGEPASQRQPWSLGALDVKTAFLYAELNEEEDGIVVAQPPAILVRLGLIPPGTPWLLNKALYGLRCAPKRWSEKERFHTQEPQVHSEW